MNSGEACACDNWICPHNEEKIKHLPGVVKGVSWLKGRVEEMRKYWMEAEEKLKVYTSWQPSDPGTKEAMEWAETLIANPKDYGIEEGPAKPHLEVLVRSTRAAIVRLEEVEKLIAVLKKTPYTLSGPNGAETLAAWEAYNGKP